MIDQFKPTFSIIIPTYNRRLQLNACLQQYKVCTIRYEDLVQWPERELEKLAQWLEIDPSGFSTEFVHDSSVGSYKHRLSAEELSIVMRTAGPRLAELGYK